MMMINLGDGNYGYIKESVIKYNLLDDVCEKMNIVKAIKYLYII